MVNFFAGVLVTLVLIILLLKIFFRDYHQSLKEARIIHQDLTQLYEKCQEVSGKMVSDLEKQITLGKDVLKSLEEKIDFPSPKVTQTKIKEAGLQENSQLQLGAESSKQKAILELANNGYSIKEISQNLGVEQDRVAMVLQLYKSSGKVKEFIENV